jgi:hypothetical protein
MELQHTSSRIPPQFYAAVAVLILLFGENYERTISRMGMTERPPLECSECNGKSLTETGGENNRWCQLIN